MNCKHLKYTHCPFPWRVGKCPRSPGLTGLTDRQFSTRRSAKSKNYNTVHYKDSTYSEQSKAPFENCGDNVQLNYSLCLLHAMSTPRMVRSQPGACQDGNIPLEGKCHLSTWDHDYIRAVPALEDPLTAGKHAWRGPRSCLQHEVAANRAWAVLSDLTLYNEKSSSTHTALILSQKAAQEQNKIYLRVFFLKLPLSLIIRKNQV